MIRKTFYLFIFWPIERTVGLLKGVGRNGVTITRAMRRGMTTNPRCNAPVSKGMTSKDVEELDRWWKTLSQAQRDQVWEAHDAELEKAAREVERKGQGTWSLTKDEAAREKALARQGLSYFVWMSTFIGFSVAFLLMLLLGNATPMFVLMSFCFLAFIAPTVLGLRVMRGQLLYGRKLSYREFFMPLPSEMSRADAGNSAGTEGKA